MNDENYNNENIKILYTEMNITVLYEPKKIHGHSDFLSELFSPFSKHFRNGENYSKISPKKW